MWGSMFVLRPDSGEDELEALSFDMVESLTLPSANSCFGNSGTPAHTSRGFREISTLYADLGLITSSNATDGKLFS